MDECAVCGRQAEWELQRYTDAYHVQCATCGPYWISRRCITSLKTLSQEQRKQILAEAKAIDEGDCPRIAMSLLT